MEPDQEAPGLLLPNLQYWIYFHDLLIPSESEQFCFNKLIAEAFSLLEAPPVVRLIHLQKLPCGVTFDHYSCSNALNLRVFLSQETWKSPHTAVSWSFVADAPVECVVLRTSAANVQPSARVRCHLPRNTSPFLGHYGELHHADVSLLLNKTAGPKFGPVQNCNGARHLLLWVRELSDQASWFPNYKVALSMSLVLQNILSKTDRDPFLEQMFLRETGSSRPLTTSTEGRPSVSGNTTHRPTGTSST